MRAWGLTRAGLATMVTVGVVAAAAVPSAAQVGHGFQDDSGIGAGVSHPGSGPATEPVSTARDGGGSGSRPTCTAGDGTVGEASYIRVPDDLLTEGQKAKVAADGGSYYWKRCGGQTVSTMEAAAAFLLPARTRGGTSVDPAQLATEALQRTPLPEPKITMAPAPDIPQLVNLTTFLWLPAEQWQTATASASAGGVTSTVTATPTRVIWDMGEGDKVVCDGPGVPYRPDLPDERQPSDCHFTYRFSSAGAPGNAFTVTATLEWETTWSVSGAPVGGSLGTVRRSASTRVQVAELQTVNVYPTAAP